MFEIIYKTFDSRIDKYDVYKVGVVGWNGNTQL